MSERNEKQNGGRRPSVRRTTAARSGSGEKRDSLDGEARKASGRSKHNVKASPAKPHRQNFVARLVNQWFDRVMGAMRTDGLEEAQAQYAPHRTTRDFVWNSLGSAAWAFVFPIVTMVSTQLVGVEQAGMISMAFVVGILLMFVGNFGVRTYQVSDTQSEHSFKDYQAMRWITCILMVVVGWLWCSVRGYANEMFSIAMGIIIYKMIDALADVYEGRLQQVDKLYLAGISQTLRSVLALITFCVILFVLHNAVIASFGMAIAAAATFIVVTWPLTLMEAPPSNPFSKPSLIGLFKVCAPLFVAIFMFNLIENMPKFVMEGMLPYDNQLYYNAIFFPAQMILILAQLVYKPLLLRMAGVWQDRSKRLKFDLILVGIIAVIAAITGVSIGIMAWIGIPIMNVLYGINFAQFRGLLFLMLVTGGITAAIDFLYQVITIMRRQKDVTVLFLVTFGFSLFIPWLLIRYAQLEGAVLSYVIIEAILFVLLVWEYFRIRSDLSGHAHGEAEPVVSDGSGATVDFDKSTKLPERGESPRVSFIDLIDPADDDIDGNETIEQAEEPPRRPRPSEQRAERQRREEIMRRRTHKK